MFLEVLHDNSSKTKEIRELFVSALGVRIIVHKSVLILYTKWDMMSLGGQVG